MLSLSEIENGHHRGLFVLGWVPLEDLFDELVVLLVELEGDVGIVLGGISMLRMKLLLSAILSWSFPRRFERRSEDSRRRGNRWLPLCWP